MTLKGMFKGKNNLRWHRVTLADKKVGYQQEGGFFGYYILVVIWRSRKQDLFC